jgi:hypothetical protein
MSRFQDNYRLETVRRFWELESQKGEGPLKKALHKLRKVHSWPSFVPANDACGKGTGDRPCPPPQGGEEVTPHVPSEPLVQQGSEKPDQDQGRGGCAASRWSKASCRSLPDMHGLARRDKRALREREYTSRRLAEFRSLRDRQRASREERPSDPVAQSKLDRTRNQINHLEGRLDEVERPPAYRPGVRIPPPRDLVPDTVPRKRALPFPIQEFVRSRDARVLSLPKVCPVKLGCTRPVGHKGRCDVSSACQMKMKGHPCDKNAGHLGDCHFVGWLCPDCGAPLGRPHNRPDCPTRLARAHLRRTG